jgi:hypothetical protein
MNDEQPPYGTDPDTDESESRAALAPFAAALSSAAVWAEAPAGLEALVVERVRAASDAAPTVAAVAPDAPPRWARGSIGRRMLPLLAAAAAVIAFSAGFAIDHIGNDDGGEAAPVADVQLTGTELAPDASASGHVVDSGAGYAIRLSMDGLAPAPEGEYYEGWLRADDGAMVSVGTFHMRGGDGSVVLWSGVRIAEYDTLVVTKQVERSPDDTSDQILLEGHIERR